MKRTLLRIALTSLFLLSPQYIWASEIIEITPKEVLVKETDIGKTFEIEIKNTGDKLLKLQANEIRINQKDQTTLEINQEESILEMVDNDFEIEPGDTYIHKIRVKFSSQGFSNIFPAIEYRNSENSEELNYKVQEIAIFLIQSLEGEYNLGLDIDLISQDISTSNKIDLKINISNQGSKYFIPQGEIAIKLKDKVLFEQEINDRIAKRLFNGEEISFDFSHELEDTSWQAIGEYLVEIKLNSDYSSNQKVGTISFIYIPDQIIYITGIGIGTITLVTILTTYIKGRKNKKDKY